MKIIVLLLALFVAFGFAVKQSAENVKEITIEQEMKELQKYPNLLPVVEVVA
ncbi:hypothetical protein WG947_15410 [Pontibacter sp. H259]|uniref:hypothetical protein n=1 Tax=Pontibacter sp. H259 TaxID=3133421 RepID=UPI0030C5E760